MSIISTPRDYVKRKTFLAVARQIGTLGTCSRAKIGAVIVRDGRCISWGYNGAPPGMPHCEHADDEPCTVATHAESNAVAFAARQGISTDGATLFVSVSPCAVCARLLIAAGIDTVVFETFYRDESGLELLAEAGVRLLV